MYHVNKNYPLVGWKGNTDAALDAATPGLEAYFHRDDSAWFPSKSGGAPSKAVLKASPPATSCDCAECVELVKVTCCLFPLYSDGTLRVRAVNGRGCPELEVTSSTASEDTVVYYPKGTKIEVTFQEGELFTFSNFMTAPSLLFSMTNEPFLDPQEPKGTFLAAGDEVRVTAMTRRCAVWVADSVPGGWTPLRQSSTTITASGDAVRVEALESPR